jgi:hypothetical protein
MEKDRGRGRGVTGKEKGNRAGNTVKKTGERSVTYRFTSLK